MQLQQLFRSQNPSLATNAGVAPPGQPTAQQQIPQTLPLPSQQYLAQQSAAYAAAAQQPTPYVINPGQDATRYIGRYLMPTTNMFRIAQAINFRVHFHMGNGRFFFSSSS